MDGTQQQIDRVAQNSWNPFSEMKKEMRELEQTLKKSEVSYVTNVAQQTRTEVQKQDINKNHKVDRQIKSMEDDYHN